MRIATEGGNIITHPFECGNKIEQTAIVGPSFEVKEAQRAKAIIDRDLNDAACRKSTALQHRLVGGTDRVTAAMDPEQHRRPARRIGRADIDREEVLAEGQFRGRGRAHRAVGGNLRADGAKPVASRAPCQGDTGCGASKRRSGVTGAA